MRVPVSLASAYHPVSASSMPFHTKHAVTVESLFAPLKTSGKVSAHSKMVAEACPMSAAEVLKAIAQLAFHIAQPLRYFQTGVSLWSVCLLL